MLQAKRKVAILSLQYVFFFTEYNMTSFAAGDRKEIIRPFWKTPVYLLYTSNFNLRHRSCTLLKNNNKMPGQDGHITRKNREFGCSFFQTGKTGNLSKNVFTWEICLQQV